jgi:hypothetical protein
LLTLTAHTDQKELIESHNSPLSAEEAAEAYREINRKAEKTAWTSICEKMM